MKSSSLILSGNEIISWEMIRPHLCVLPYHFAVISFIARNRILNSESSVGNTVLVLVTFLSCRLNPSMALVVPGKEVKFGESTYIISYRRCNRCNCKFYL